MREPTKKGLEMRVRFLGMHDEKKMVGKESGVRFLTVQILKRVRP